MQVLCEPDSSKVFCTGYGTVAHKGHSFFMKKKKKWLFLKIIAIFLYKYRGAPHKSEGSFVGNLPMRES